MADGPHVRQVQGNGSTDSSSELPHSAAFRGECATDTPRKPRISSEVERAPASCAKSSSRQANNNSSERLILRTLTYFIYDRFSIAGGQKEIARIGKACVELLVDERFPPPHRVDMTLQRKCVEFLFAPAASSLIWFIAKSLQPFHRKKPAGAHESNRSFVFFNALWTVVHRVGRQALIYRLFFRIGSVRYSLASALGIVCCFFKETLFPDLLRFGRWPIHFSSSQGVAAILRSFVYAVAFALPLHRISKSLRESPRRRCNVKKLIFAITLSQSQRILEVARSMSSVHAWAA